jgi:hypothetical protein
MIKFLHYSTETLYHLSMVTAVGCKLHFSPRLLLMGHVKWDGITSKAAETNIVIAGFLGQLNF